MKRSIIILILLAVLVLTALCWRKFSESAMITGNNVLLDTVVTLNIYEYEDKQIIQDTFDLIRDYEKILSVHYPDSDLDKLSQSSGTDFVKVSPDTVYLLRESIKYSEMSDGKFDVTIGPLVSLWNIRDNKGHVPTQAELDKTLPLIDYRKILIKDDEFVKLETSGMAGDFGAIAKGYIGDKVKEFLLSKGVKSAVINLGGNIVLIGGKPNGEPFCIGIQDPIEGNGKCFGVVMIKDRSLVSSGPYERFFELDGKRYHHILDPETGFPTDNELLQTTIIANDSTQGEGLSTTAFLLGLDKAMDLIKGIEGVEAVFVTKDKKVYATDGLNDILTITSGEYNLCEWKKQGAFQKVSASVYN